MGRPSLIGALLLVFVASSRSLDTIQETTEETTQSEEPLMFSSTASPSVNQPQVAKLESSTDGGVTSGELSASPRRTSNEVNSTGDATVQNVSLTTDPTTGLRGPSTNLKTARLPTIPARGNIDGSEIPAADRDATDLPAANNGTDVDRHGTPGKTEGTTAASTTKRPGQETPKGPGQETPKGPGQETPKGPGQETPKGPGQETPRGGMSDAKRRKIHILIGVFIAILIFILVLMVFMILRKKKRSGSFRTSSKMAARQDVWAGQVPELGDGKATQEVAGNGRAGNGPGATDDREMVTFVSGEKKMDSVLEMAEEPEANGGEEPSLGEEPSRAEEKTPLLEEASLASPKAGDPQGLFPAPPGEQ